jgi:hypothetical protein
MRHHLPPRHEVGPDTPLRVEDVAAKHAFPDGSMAAFVRQEWLTRSGTALG